ncbi:transketolase family protein [Candidatus Nitronereus thalassa]|uniref:Transketolase family protein n=1 Tax=Candidatus Nitronereus thalassa TaxID=3020898 RepID=A0ABU3K648_9BACT|nr:transketolase family protein [Candidatus Nitronereus thalassa]MDT7041844.1 transketolase family protein [Candidatus Nitronereus thalassa]
MGMCEVGQPVPVQIGSSGDSLREAFGRTLVQLGDQYLNFVVLDADIAGGTGTHHFRKAFPDRFYQCGIAEQNMMGVAGGIASVGLVPFVTTFAVFCLRALEQARLSVAYAKRNVKIVASHPGLDVGPDGGSAQCLEDLAAFRAIPGMVVISPADPYEMEQATKAVLMYDGPVYMRTGRSPAKRILHPNYQFEIGKGQILQQGKDVTIIACGVEVARALDAAVLLAKEGLSVRVVNMSTIKPIDRELVVSCAQETGAIVTAEDHNIYGGLGSAVAEVLVRDHPCPMEFVGVKDSFGESGEPEELAVKYGLCSKGIAEAVCRVLKRRESMEDSQATQMARSGQ